MFEGRINVKVRQQGKVRKKDLEKVWKMKLNSNVELRRSKVTREVYSKDITWIEQ